MLVAHLFLRLCFLVVPLPTRSTLFPYTTLFRSVMPARLGMAYTLDAPRLSEEQSAAEVRWQVELPFHQHLFTEPAGFSDRKSTRLNSSHVKISYAVFCLKKKINLESLVGHPTAS